jgi:hypothetical protein
MSKEVIEFNLALEESFYFYKFFLYNLKVVNIGCCTLYECKLNLRSQFLSHLKYLDRQDKWHIMCQVLNEINIVMVWKWA